MKLLSKNGKAITVGMWLSDVGGIYEVVEIDEYRDTPVHAKEVFFDLDEDDDALETYTLKGDYYWMPSEVRKMHG